MRKENVELTVLCMIYRGDEILLQNRRKEDWKGYTFPGGHVEKNESFVDALKREMKEETGLTIHHPKLAGVKQFDDKEGRYVVLLFKCCDFEGELMSSNEGEVVWVKRSRIASLDTVNDFEELLAVFDEDELNEFFYDQNGRVHLK